MPNYADDLATHLVSRLSTTPSGAQVLSPVDLIYDIDGVDDQNVFTLFEAGDDYDRLIDNAYPGIVIVGPCVMLIPTGGFTRLNYLQDTNDATTPFPQDSPGQDFPGFLILIRSEVGDPQQGRDLADAVFQGLVNSPPTGYFASRAAGSESRWLKKDAKNRAIFGFNLTVSRDCVS